uniref:C3H1-type domain-containing protein n=1 Tax=Magallana gigas TaxID=29159 RepID=A0A8W8NNP8_MAGGI
MLGDKAWRIYDENFRMLKETVELPWQKPVEELRVKAASSNYQFQQPFRANTGNKPIRFCYAFNNGEQCTYNPCSFAHRCQSCSGSHARANCRYRKQKPTLSPSSKQSPSQLPSPVNPKSLGEFLVDYDSDQASYLINGFTHGFRLGCTSAPSSCVPQNHKSTLDHPDIIEDYIQTGLNKGRIAAFFPWNCGLNLLIEIMWLTPVPAVDAVDRCYPCQTSFYGRESSSNLNSTNSNTFLVYKAKNKIDLTTLCSHNSFRPSQNP